MKQLNFKKSFVATVLGGITLFMWGGLSHSVIFIGTGFKQLPNEEKVIEALKGNIPEQGLYFFPGKDFRNSTEEQELAFETKFRTGPAGMLIYRPIGGSPFSADKLTTQLFSNVLSVLIAVLIASMIHARYWIRVAVITLLGLLACSAVSSIYWNWYEFPTSFFVAQILDMVIGFFLTGLVICRLIPQPSVSSN